jgi:ATP-dependent helicase HepA
LDLVLGSETGNSSFAWWPDADVVGLYLEAVYVLESIAPLHLHIDRFLPPTPLHVLVDQLGNQISDTPVLEAADGHALLANPELRSTLLPELIRRAEAIANSRAPEIVARAGNEMRAQLEHEIGRLTELRIVNPSVPAAEIDVLAEQQRELDQCLQSARLRLDAIRLIERGPGRGYLL